jgi:hypothetical protein
MTRWRQRLGEEQMPSRCGRAFRWHILAARSRYPRRTATPQQASKIKKLGISDPQQSRCCGRHRCQPLKREGCYVATTRSCWLSVRICAQVGGVAHAHAANDQAIAHLNRNAKPSGLPPLLSAELVARDLPSFATTAALIAIKKAPPLEETGLRNSHAAF